MIRMFAACALALTSTAAAQVGFTRLIDSTTPVPGAPDMVAFHYFEAEYQGPALSGGSVTLYGRSRTGQGGPYRAGLYRAARAGWRCWPT
jgi:hypothetical protein